MALNNEFHDVLFTTVLVIMSVTYGFSTFVLVLAVIEGKLLKSSIMKSEEHELMPIRSRGRRFSHRDINKAEDINGMYDKIDAQYLEENQPTEDTVQSQDSAGEPEFSSWNYNHRNQSQDLTTPNSAELILRQLFVPQSQANDDVFYENLPVPSSNAAGERQPDSASGATSIVRRFTFDTAASFSQSQQRRKSSLSSLKKPSKHHHHQTTKRRKALVFSNRLDFSDDTYSTIV